MSIKKKVLLRSGPLLKIILSWFFDTRYLKGRYFDQSVRGYLWAAKAIWMRNVLRLGPTYPWPVGLSCWISKPENIEFDPDDLNNFQSPGVYLQNIDAKIFIGHGSYIGPNVGIITSNHNLTHLDEHASGKSVHIGEECWLGMNSVILPGVKLGRGTIVGAGSVVTHSFPQGGVVLGGVPARVLKLVLESSLNDETLKE